MQNEAGKDFFEPLWRRIVLVAVVAVWFGYELIFVGEALWTVITGGLLAYATLNYLIRWRKNSGSPPGPA